MLIETRIPTLVAAVAMGLLAAWLIYLRPRDRVHRALALFLVFRALFYGLRSFAPTIFSLQSRLGRYAEIAIPFAAANFAIVFWGRYGAGRAAPRLRERVARWGLLLAAVGFEVLYMVDHDLMLGPQAEAPLTLFQPLTYLAYVAIALTIYVSLDKARPHHRTGLWFLAVGFALEPAFWGTFATLQLGIAVPGGEPVLWARNLLFLATGLGVGFLVAWAGWTDVRRGAGADRPRAPRLAGAITLPVACALIANAIWEPPFTAFDEVWLFGFDAFWHLALVLFASYALLRHELFGIDLKLKLAVEQSTVAAVFAGAFFLASEGLEMLVPVEGTLLGIGAALAIVIVLHPVRTFAQAVANRLLPTVEDTEAYRQRRATELYRTSVEEAGMDGRISGRERVLLDNLRSSLGLPEEEADRIEADVLDRDPGS